MNKESVTDLTVSRLGTYFPVVFPFVFVGSGMFTFALAIETVFAHAKSVSLISLLLFAFFASLPLAMAVVKRPGKWFGWANTITLVRLSSGAFLLSYLLLGQAANHAWIIFSVALGALILDGVDGWLARRLESHTAYGARFDMEVDGFMVFIITLLVVALDKSGLWLLVAPLLRYLFLMMGTVFDWMAHPLPESLRRKSCFVAFMLCAIISLAPILPGSFTYYLSGFGFFLLCYSFLYDTLWLHRLYVKNRSKK